MREEGEVAVAPETGGRFEKTLAELDPILVSSDCPLVRIFCGSVL